MVKTVASNPSNFCKSKRLPIKIRPTKCVQEAQGPEPTQSPSQTSLSAHIFVMN